MVMGVNPRQLSTFPEPLVEVICSFVQSDRHSTIQMETLLNSFSDGVKWTFWSAGPPGLREFLIL